MLNKKRYAYIYAMSPKSVVIQEVICPTELDSTERLFHFYIES